MTNLTRIEVCCDPNCENNNVPQVIELTSEEITQMEADAAAFAAQQEEADQAAAALAALKASAKAKLIAGTPLTAEEADTLVI
jgi:hypothetical protein